MDKNKKFTLIRRLTEASDQFFIGAVNVGSEENPDWVLHVYEKFRLTHTKSVMLSNVLNLITLVSHIADTYGCFVQMRHYHPTYEKVELPSFSSKRRRFRHDPQPVYGYERQFTEGHIVGVYEFIDRPYYEILELPKCYKMN